MNTFLRPYAGTPLSADRSTITRFLSTCLDLTKLTNNETVFEIDLTELMIFDAAVAYRFFNDFAPYQSLVFDILDTHMEIPVTHRTQRFKEKFPDKDILGNLPAELYRNYKVHFACSAYEPCKIVDLPGKIGHLVKFSMTVTKVIPPCPVMRLATYICDSCGSESYQRASNTFSPLTACNSCKSSTIILMHRASVYESECSIFGQEAMSDVGTRRIPRTVHVIYDHAICKPGDEIEVTGHISCNPTLNREWGMLCDQKVVALNITVTSHMKISFVKLPDTNIESIARIVFPYVAGWDEIKKLLLLQLVGAYSPDNIPIRPSLNVLLVGDPGLSKSVMLQSVAPYCKGVYVNGRGATAVGLTASVSRIGNEVVLEPGAFVLSDGGMTIIDELDKMNEEDRVGLHEVMEQQTVSISKAGIVATLPARVAVLAACNRFKNRVNLPISLQSRFDVIYKMDGQSVSDVDVADCVIEKHFSNENVLGTRNAEVQELLNSLRSLKPVLSQEINDMIIDHYCYARKSKKVITPRYVMSIMRLAIAHAKLRCSFAVEEVDVNEAIKLLSSDNVDERSVYKRIVDLVKLGLTVDQICQRLGNIKHIIKEYEDLGVWIVSDGGVIELFE